MEQARKDEIEATARDHFSREVYDNSICRSGVERNLYLKTHMQLEESRRTKSPVDDAIIKITADSLDTDLDGAAGFMFRALCMQEF